MFQRLLTALIVLFVLCANCVKAQNAQDVAGLLTEAEQIKTSNPVEFKTIVKRLSDERQMLTPQQQEYLRYLQAWQIAYDGDYEHAIAALKELGKISKDTTLRFRANVAVANLQALTSHYEDAFSQLSQSVASLSEISDQNARQQLLGVAAQLYNQVGEYDLGLNYAEKLIAEGHDTRSACRGVQMKLEALFKSGKVLAVGPEFQAAIDTCIKFDEISYANVIRTYMARLYINAGKADEALVLLNEHYKEVLQSRYSRLISQYDVLLAQAYREIGDPMHARQFSMRAVTDAVKNEYTEPLVSAYRMLYILAKEQGDSKAALAYHEKYTTADKGYLDVIGAQQLAYQRVKHELIANQLQIDALHKQNQVLHLQSQLNDKAIENARLYVILLTMGLGFIVLWAYKTKRSQLHFMKLSRQDGLTGIFNRPHFIDQTTRALVASKKTTQEMCVAICDLDHFKAVNDNWGHAAGDDVLKRTAAVFVAHLREEDIVGRLGGEEFGLAFIGCDIATARQRCEQLRAALAEICVEEEGARYNLSASFGISTTTASGHDFRQLLAHADTALYKAKRSGRNLVVLHDQDKIASDTSSIVVDARLRA